MDTTRLALLARRSDLSPAEFGYYWLTTHADIVAQSPVLTSYTQHHVVHELWAVDNGFQIDGIADMTYSSEITRSPSQALDLESDEMRLLSGVTLIPVLASEPSDSLWSIWFIGLGVDVTKETIVDDLPGFSASTLRRRDFTSPLMARPTLRVVNPAPTSILSFHFVDEKGARAAAEVVLRNHVSAPKSVYALLTRRFTIR